MHKANFQGMLLSLMHFSICTHCCLTKENDGLLRQPSSQWNHSYRGPSQQELVCVLALGLGFYVSSRKASIETRSS
jgi:hypothetical protein